MGELIRISEYLLKRAIKKKNMNRTNTLTLQERVARIQESVRRINDLQEELKNGKSTKDN